jgi:Ribbon-helix-helix protein, copG family
VPWRWRSAPYAGPQGVYAPPHRALSGRSQFYGSDPGQSRFTIGLYDALPPHAAAEKHLLSRPTGIPTTSRADPVCGDRRDEPARPLLATTSVTVETPCLAMSGERTYLVSRPLLCPRGGAETSGLGLASPGPQHPAWPLVTRQPPRSAGTTGSGGLIHESPSRPDTMADRIYTPHRALRYGYNPVILSGVKTAISLPDRTFERVEDAAKRLGVSRSEFFARAAERWLDALDEDGTTEAINGAVGGLEHDHAFTDAAAAALAANDEL